jgi:hypothetical protein
LKRRPEDNNFGMAGDFIDMPPDQAAVLKKTMNINRDRTGWARSGASCGNRLAATGRSLLARRTPATAATY